MTIPYLACMAATAVAYQLPPRVLPAIAAVEAGRIGLVRLNEDGSQDLGIMQINTRWVQPLAAATGLGSGTVKDRLLSDACFNIAAAGAILRLSLNETHGDLLLAVGNYHSHQPALSQQYQDRVLRAAAGLFGSNGSIQHGK